MIRSCAILAGALLAAALAGEAPAQVLPGWHDDQSIRSGGTTRYFRYYVPATLSAARPPMVIFLHGGTSSMRDAMPPADNGAAHWPTVAEAEGFILLVPNGMNGVTGDAFGDEQNWNDCRSDPGPAESTADDVGFITDLVDWSAEHLEIDTTRVYATGNSNGGMMSFRLADEAPRRFAAVATFIANQPENSECAPSEQALPMMIVVGSEDEIMPFGGGQVLNRRGLMRSADDTRDLWLERNRLAGTDPELTQFPDRDSEDGSVVNAEVYAVNGRELRYYVVEGGGHSMPSIARRISAVAEAVVGPQNRDIEGAEEAWAFLQRFTVTAPENALSLSGLWFDPTLPGDGFNLVAGDTASVVYFYGSDTRGQRLWLISEPFQASLAAGSEFEIELYQATEGSFDTPADPETHLERWGQLRWTIRSCRRIDSSLEGDAGERKSAELVKLLGIDGADC